MKMTGMIVWQRTEDLDRDGPYLGDEIDYDVQKTHGQCDGLGRKCWLRMSNETEAERVGEGVSWNIVACQ
jgi:hypothetical protein